VEEIGRQRGDVVEGTVWRRVEDLISPKRVQALGFAARASSHRPAGDKLSGKKCGRRSLDAFFVKTPVGTKAGAREFAGGA
jgi:hypothetical protein